MILIGLGYAGAGRFIRYVPVPVVEGFTVGIAVIIALQQVPAALGVDVHAEKVLVLATRAINAWATHPDWVPLAIAAGVTVVVLALSRFVPLLPGSLIAVVAATVANSIFGWGAATIGHIPNRLPAPTLPDVPWGDLDALLLPAVAVAALAALESLLSATVADAMSVGQRHDSDRELVGQGLANLAAPLFGGHPRHRGDRPHGGQRPVRGGVPARGPFPRPGAARHRAGRGQRGSPRSRALPSPASWSPPRSRWCGSPA